MPRKPRDERPQYDIEHAPLPAQKLAAQYGLTIRVWVYRRHHSEHHLWMFRRGTCEIGSWVVKTGSYRAGAVMGKSDDWHAVLLAMVAHGRVK